MEQLEYMEYGNASNLQYKFTIDHLHPTTELPLQPSDLFVTLYIRNDLDEDAEFSVTGSYNATSEAFDFTFTEEQAELMTPDTWYYGFEVRVTDINGKPIHKRTYSRKVEKTGAKS